MNNDINFFYDGKCPFCNHFAELLELKSNLKNISFIDARTNKEKLPSNYDMDIKGALLISENKLYSGSEAISFILSRVKNPSDSLLALLKIIFISPNRSKFLFPLLIFARRTLLTLKGVPRKLL
ncbi:DUF393 domain-containing protein [Prochlorococcus sp. AH-716-B04]|nr:DUF393 domain-containing protein [Prochlorococcus sp. AH-716-B04]